MRSELTRTAAALVLACWPLGRAWLLLARTRRDRAVRRRLGALFGSGAGPEFRRPAAGRRGRDDRKPRRGSRRALAHGAAVLRGVPVPVRAAVVAGVLCAGAFLGPVAVLPAGAAGAFGARWWLRRTEAGRASAEDRRAAARLPLAADLLAACASAGAGPGEAAEAVGRSLGGPLGERLLRTAAELRLGGDPAEVWGRFGAIPGAEGLARCMERAGASGAPAAEAIARHAAALRAADARAATGRARRAQVLISAPVGLCFLPAFLAVGVAPVVIGLASGLLGP
ncbi:type II secretion system F family protein [Streptomyces griseus]|uniref:type II secretion system F family protein n=1 Tax=Streptomyces griseus TaxID=1911 RepID=UPI000AC25D1D|nr:type II secretion system F family protein [Streptomyces griseus]